MSAESQDYQLTISELEKQIECAEKVINSAEPLIEMLDWGDYSGYAEYVENFMEYDKYGVEE